MNEAMTRLFEVTRRTLEEVHQRPEVIDFADLSKDLKGGEYEHVLYVISVQLDEYSIPVDDLLAHAFERAAESIGYGEDWRALIEPLRVNA